MTTKTETFNFVENPLATRWTKVLAVADFQSTASGAKRASTTFSIGATMWKTSDYTFANNQRATITFGTIVTDDRVGVIVRAATAGGGQFYEAYYHDANGQVIVNYWTGGALSATKETIGSTSFVATDTLSLDVTGTTLRAYKNGVAIGVGSTDSNLTSGQTGICYRDFNSNTSLISVFSGVDAAAVPNISSTSSLTPANGSALTITGTLFGASQGSGSVTIGGISQSVTSWSATSIVVTVARGTNKYGVSLNVVVTDTSAGVSNSYALTSLQPQANWSFIDITSTTGTSLTASPALASGDQLAYQSNFGSAGDVVIDVTANYSAVPAVTSFQWEAWSVSGGGWGSIATETIGSAAGGVAATSRRRNNLKIGLGL